MLNNRHVKRVLQSYVEYDRDWRPHWSLEMDAPLTRPVQGAQLGAVRKVAEVGGFDHHYERRAACGHGSETLRFQLLQDFGTHR